MEQPSLHDRLRAAIVADGQKSREEQERQEQSLSPGLKAARAAAVSLIEKLIREASPVLADLPDKPTADTGSDESAAWFRWSGTTKDESIAAILKVRFDREQLDLSAKVQTPARDSMLRHLAHSKQVTMDSKDEAKALEWLTTEFVNCGVAYRRKVLSP